MPMVVMKDGVNESSLKRSRQHDLPTPESPISSSLICWNGQCQHHPFRDRNLPHICHIGGVDDDHYVGEGAITKKS
jgi:hypothetical protein